MTKIFTTIFLVTVFTLTCCVSLSRAEIVINGDVSQTTSGELVVTSDIVFTLLAPNDLLSGIVFDEWATHDGSQTQINMTPWLNVFTDVAGDTTSNSSILDNQTNNSGDLTENDGKITLSGNAESAISTFILKSGSYSFGGFDWNPILEGGFTFTGNAFLVDNTNTRVSNIVSTASSVPEPGGFLLFTMALGCSAFRRKRLQSRSQK